MTPGIATFGQTAAGETVRRITIASEGLSAAILTRGAILQDVRLAGTPHSLTVGSPDLAAYEGPYSSCGAIVGPVANRIAGATGQIDGTTYRFDANQQDRHTLHGGRAGTHRLTWELLDHATGHVTLGLSLAHLQQGFPGNRRLTARYQVKGATLRLTLTAATDAPTLMNLANHSYWRLDDAPSFAGQTLQIEAEHYLPTDRDLIPTGEIAPVQGTRFDYREGRVLTADPEGALDTNFCLAAGRQPLRRAALLTGRSGLILELATTEPGLQVYDGRSLAQPGLTGNDGVSYGPYAGLALEAQFWPDAPHHPPFPDITLRPGQDWRQVTTWTFRTGSSSL